MGERFGRYELLRRIATGGMAEIYLARADGPEGFEKHLVVKLILPHLAESEEFVDMFLHEARVAVRLNHPNIVQILDLGEAEGAYFIAMEYVHGEDVRRVWRRSVEAQRPIPVPLACRIACEAAAGLDYAHRAVDSTGRPLQIIHRDISPQNLLVSFEGAVKVADFGIARAADRVGHTRSGVVKGKYSYMSPEQAAGKKIDQRTDQFALGVVLHELLTRRRLFKRPTEIETLHAVAECKVLPPSEVDPRVPKALDAIVLTALARRPQDRYPDLSALRQALEDWLLSERQLGSTAHLKAYLSTLYAERLERERAAGGPVFDAEPSSGGGGRRRGSYASASPRGGAGRGGGSQTQGPRPRGTKRLAWLGALLAVLAVLAGGVALAPLARGHGSRPGAVREALAPVGGIRVQTVPPGARALLDARELPGRTPIAAGGIALGDHEVVVALEGYRDEARRVTLKRDGEVEQVSVALAPVAAAAPVAAPALAAEARPRPAPQAREARPTARAAPAPDEKGEKGERGDVQIVVKPVTMGADIYLGGRKLGSAPLKRFSLPEGDYLLTVVNEELQKTRRVAVSVRAGQLSKKTVDLTEE